MTQQPVRYAVFPFGWTGSHSFYSGGQPGHGVAYEDWHEWLGNRDERPLTRGRGRILRSVRRDGGDIVLRHINTDVVRFHPDGTATLKTGGWETPMTGRTINLATGHRVYRKGGTLYVAGIGPADGARVPVIKKEMPPAPEVDWRPDSAIPEDYHALSRRGYVKRYSMDANTAVNAVRSAPHDPAARGAVADWLEENDLHARPETLHHLRNHQGPVWIMPDGQGKIDAGPHLSIPEIKARMEARGSKWWTRDNMRFFGTRVGNKTFSGPGGTWFVTSDHDFHRDRGFSLRHYDPESGDINTVGEGADTSARRPTLERLAARFAQAKTPFEAYKWMYEYAPREMRIYFAYWLHGKGLADWPDLQRIMQPEGDHPAVRMENGKVVIDHPLPRQMSRLPRGLKVRLSRASRRHLVRRYSLATEHDFHSAIMKAQPGDFLPHLVFADWLDENNKPFHAELVRQAANMGQDAHPQSNFSGGAESNLSGAFGPINWPATPLGGAVGYPGHDSIEVMMRPKSHPGGRIHYWLRGKTPEEIMRLAVGLQGEGVKMPDGFPVRFARPGRPALYAKCPRCGSPGRRNSSKFYKWVCKKCGLSHSRTKEGLDGKLPWTWGGKKGYARPVRYARPSDYNRLFSEAAQRFHDSLPPEQQAAHLPELRKFQSLDHFGLIRGRVGGNPEIAHDVATRLLYGGDQGKSFFAGHDPAKASLSTRFFHHVKWQALNAKKEAAGLKRVGNEYVGMGLFGSMGEPGEQYEPQGRKVSSDMLVPAAQAAQQDARDAAMMEMRGQGMTHEQIGAKLGLTKRQVEGRVATMGQTRAKTPPPPPETAAQVHDLKAAGHSIRQIADQLGMRRSTVVAVLGRPRPQQMSRRGRPARYAMDAPDWMRAVRSNPADPATKGALADWLEETGLHHTKHTLRHLRSDGPVYTEVVGGKVRAVPMMTWHQLGPMQRAYLDAALWSSVDNDLDPADGDYGRPLDERFGIDGFDHWTLNEMAHDVNHFWSTLPQHLREEVSDRPEYAGHDLWLTRNGHGSGFFDRDYWQSGNELADHVNRHFGEYELSVGTDSKVHGQGYRKNPGGGPSRQSRVRRQNVYRVHYGPRSRDYKPGMRPPLPVARRVQGDPLLGGEPQPLGQFPTARRVPTAPRVQPPPVPQPTDIRHNPDLDEAFGVTRQPAAQGEVWEGHVVTFRHKNGGRRQQIMMTTGGPDAIRARLRAQGHIPTHIRPATHHDFAAQHGGWTELSRGDSGPSPDAVDYAAWRAPGGGMVVRGTYYPGGRLVPDLERFASPPARRR